MKLAIFGGTFDPIHQAHLAVAEAAAERCSLDRILFVAAARPPHKLGATHAAYEDRIRMIQLAVQVDPRFEASRLEEFSARSYSIDTIERVRSSLGLEDTLFFLIGADAYAEIETWHRWRDVVQAVRFIVVSRPGFHLPEAVPPPFEWIDGISLEISSSSIRRALAAGQRPHGLPPAVLQYAVSRRLYCPELS